MRAPPASPSELTGRAHWIQTRGPRTVLLYVPAAALLAANWLRLEQPRAGAWSVLALAGLALTVALGRPAWLRAPILVAAALAATNIAFAGASLTSASVPNAPWLPTGLPSAVTEGLLSFYDVTLPLDPRLHPFMHGVLLLAVFGFCLAVGLLIAARRPLGAALVVLVGTGWPATLEPGGGDVARGLLALLVVLLLLVGCTRSAPSRLSHALVASSAACMMALAAAASPAVARSGLLDWQRWDLYTKPDRAVSVAYVWHSTYDGLHFPRHSTIVFTVKAPERPLYWRATTLDVFDGRGWEEAPLPTAAERIAGRDVVPDDPPIPSLRGERLVRQKVTMRALRDTHLVAASIPVAYRTDDLGLVNYAAGGIALTPSGVARGASYSAWSLVAQPTPKRLQRSSTHYPESIRARFLTVAPGVHVPAFGTPKRRAILRSVLRRRSADGRVAPYAALARQATRVVGGARSPYAAALALEAWFRLSGVFRYDQQPPASQGAPPLVDFVLRTHRGYCQHYAGAMALMLRYLGIPARVAAGFTSGSYDSADGTWTVTDHEAHTWVEVWFNGVGWLPFDPTPTRGGLGGSYSAASPRFDATGALAALGGAALGLQALRDRLGAGDLKPPRLSLRASRESGKTGGHVLSGARVLGGAGLGVVVAALLLLLAKSVRRGRRVRGRGTRLLASACRAELVAFLADQGIDVPLTATSRDLGELVEDRLGVDARTFTRALDRARFAPAERAEADAARCHVELRRLLASLRARLTPLERARGFVSLRSFGVA